MELVDVPDSKSGAARRVGSSPTRGTTAHACALLFISRPIYQRSYTDSKLDKQNSFAKVKGVYQKGSSLFMFRQDFPSNRSSASCVKDCNLKCL